MPDFTIFSHPNLEEPWMLQIQEHISNLESKGITFFRFTTFNDELHSFCIEGWKIQPQDQGPEPKLSDFQGFGKQDNMEC